MSNSILVVFISIMVTCVFVCVICVLVSIYKSSSFNTKARRVGGPPPVETHTSAMQSTFQSRDGIRAGLQSYVWYGEDILLGGRSHVTL